jgi:hypothetical protein
MILPLLTTTCTLLIINNQTTINITISTPVTDIHIISNNIYIESTQATKNTILIQSNYTIIDITPISNDSSTQCIIPIIRENYYTIFPF